MSNTHFACFGLFIFYLAPVVSIPAMYPFGSIHGDLRLPNNDDTTYPAINLNSSFTFFNRSHDFLFVNTNGDITFGNALSSFTPAAFPYQQDLSLLTPFWADIDTRYFGGNIWYRESYDRDILQRAQSEIAAAFPNETHNNVTWSFIATWDNVTFYGADQVGSLKRCSFQCVLVSNGLRSYVMFIYTNMEWTTGTSNGGYSSTGAGGIPAQIGFDAGDGINYYTVPGSRTPHIINITQMSNIGVPGQFIFNVDTSIRKATVVLHCDTIMCFNGGVCVDLNDTVGWRCDCPAVFSGVLCEIAPTTPQRTTLTPTVTSTTGAVSVLSVFNTMQNGPAKPNAYGITCRDHPCIHGSCLQFYYQFICYCEAGYRGRFCETDKDECRDGPCKYGMCVDRVNDFYCECSFLFSGKRCSKPKPWLILAFSVAVISYFSSCFCCVMSRINKRKMITSKTRITPLPAPAGRPNDWLY